MAMSTNCCLNLSPPTSGSGLPSSTTRTTQVASFRNEKWRSQCVLGMACIIIGLEVGEMTSENLAIAKDMQLVVESKEEKKGTKWSDQRMCPPWHVNSLETIVPENLPRPSYRRRFEAVGYSKNAPAIKVSVKSSRNCFSM